MRKIEETFEWQVRKHKDGALYECDIYFDIVEPGWIRDLVDKVAAPIRAIKIEPAPAGATPEQIKELANKADDSIKKANDEAVDILKTQLAQKYSKKNKDMTLDEVMEIFVLYPVVRDKFIKKWHEVCFKQTFRGLELDKDS
jgi:hypothetical protein